MGLLGPIPLLGDTRLPVYCRVTHKLTFTPLMPRWLIVFEFQRPTSVVFVIHFFSLFSLSNSALVWEISDCSDTLIENTKSCSSFRQRFKKVVENPTGLVCSVFYHLYKQICFTFVSFVSFSHTAGFWICQLITTKKGIEPHTIKQELSGEKKMLLRHLCGFISHS